MDARYLRVKNWTRFQHYDPMRRRVRWIKMYGDLLDPADPFVTRLTELEEWQLVRVWLLASRSELLTRDETGALVPVVADDERSLRRSIGSLKPVPLAKFIRDGWLIPVSSDEIFDPAEPTSPASKPAEEKASSASGPLKEQEGLEKVLATASTSPQPTGKPPAARPPNPCWDFVVAVKGEPLPKQRAGYGRITADLTTLLDRDTTPPDYETRLHELQRRHTALVSEWGESKATPRALVEHWQMATRLADGTARPPQRSRVQSLEDRMAAAATNHIERRRALGS